MDAIDHWIRTVARPRRGRPGPTRTPRRRAALARLVRRLDEGDILSLSELGLLREYLADLDRSSA